MEKINGTSKNLVETKTEELKELFPNIITDGKIDFDVLRNMLGDEVDERKEKYQFTWPGKSDSIKLAQSPSSSTLRPLKEKSKDWDTTENLYIEGDNLEVLKQLQKTYYGMIKMIYIDPPYNTGGDFVYKDDFKKSIENYKEQTNQTTKSNPETSGRYHTDWLNMMYPRLILARNLLTENGVIFISIDNNENSNLRKICDEIFGESNFVNQLAVEMTPSSGVKRAHRDRMFIKNVETILVYKKSQLTLNPLYDSWSTFDRHYSLYFDGNRLSNISDEIFKLNKLYASVNSNYYMYIDEIKKWIISNSHYIYRTHDASKWALNDVANGEILYSKDRTIVKVNNPDNSEEYELLIEVKNNSYNRLEPLSWNLIDGDIKTLRGDLWLDFDKDMGNVSKEGSIPYPNGKKPIRLLKDIIKSTTSDEDIILDFFAGSGTTAHAVMDINALQKTKRKYIMVQLPEEIDYSKTENKKYYGEYGFITVCDLSEKRIDISGNNIKNSLNKNNSDNGLFEDECNNFDLDIGFKVFKLDSTNINPWDNENQLDEKTIFETASVFKSDRSNEDILYEIMLKYGIFDQKAEEVKINNKTMYRVGERYMIVCLENGIDETDIKAIGDEKPKVVVFNEEGFKDDNAKINAEYNLKKSGVEDVKCI